MKSYDLMVIIGRLQPIHNGHQELILDALSRAQNVLILLGSANESRTFRNPFTFHERKELIELNFPSYLDRLIVRPLDDHPDDNDWLDEVQSHIRNVCLINKLSSFAFIVCDKDLHTLKNNNQIRNLSYPVYKHIPIYTYHATNLRAALFENARPSDLVSISKSTKSYLERKWSSIRNSVLLENNNPKQTDKTVKHKWYHKKPFIIFVNIFKRIFY